MDLTLQVGKYEVQKHLGKGATGTVYLAKDTFTGREVALKTIEPEVFHDPEFGTVYRSQFLNEASLAGKLRHPHIVSILDAVVSEESGYIDMLMQRIIEEHARLPSKLRADLPKPLDGLVLRALKKDPKQRYATWAEFALELSKAGPLVLPAGSIPDSEKYVLLKNVSMLTLLADSELWELARAGRWKRVVKGKQIVKAKERGMSFFFLAQGES